MCCDLTIRPVAWKSYGAITHEAKIKAVFFFRRKNANEYDTEDLVSSKLKTTNHIAQYKRLVPRSYNLFNIKSKKKKRKISNKY